MREVQLTDTLSGERRTLEPGPGGEVGIYACGPTTYGPIHIGNARAYVVPMLMRRFLAHQGYVPTLVINLTDVNDKIYAAAAEAGVPSAEHAARMITGYVADTDALGLGRPDHEPRATETIGPIVAMIEALIERGHAYESAGDVLFRVRSFTDYGQLSNRDPDEMVQGEDAGSGGAKEDPLDFALWKRRKPQEDTFWPSPWGDGRPGWHIECSAMAEELLGLDFQVHGGGFDLVFPHHENELAQTSSARGRPLAKIWFHNGMVETSAAEKMSKSLGNIFQLDQALDAFGASAVVGYLISAHPRQPLAFSEDALREAAARNARVREFLREQGEASAGAARSGPVEASMEAFLAALADDFNTPRANAELFSLIATARREPLAGAVAAIREMLGLLGLEELAEDDVGEGPGEEAEALLAERGEARADRDFARADAIRDQLAGLGYEVRDSAEGASLVRRG